MVGLTLAGSLIGLVPPLALGRFVDALVAGRSGWAATVWAAAIGAAVLGEAAVYVVSDGLYARVASNLYRDLRALMFEGLLRRGLDRAKPGPLASRFVSDAETLEHLTVAALDQGTVSVADLAAALVALGLLGGWMVAVAMAAMAAAAVVVRRLQRPAAAAGEHRQEALEEMTRTLADERTGDPELRRRSFRAALELVARSERRLGWIAASNRHGTFAVAGLGPVLVLVAGALAGGASAGTLLAVYLLAARAFGAVETLLDATLDVEVARGAAARCFALVDEASAA